MILGIGVDIIKTARFEGMTKNFMARVFTPREQAYLSHKGYISAAGLFAAKEAVAKALGTGFKGFWPNQIEITHDGHGRPEVILHDKAARIAEIMAGGQEYGISLSISHTNSDAIAFVVISKGNYPLTHEYTTGIVI